MTLLVTLDARTCLVPIGVFPGRYWTHLGQPRLLRVHWPKTNSFCPNNSKVCISQGRRDLSFSLLSIVLQWFSQHENLKKMAFTCDHKQPMRNSDFHGRTNLSVVCFRGVGEKVFLSVGSLKALAAKAIFRAGDHEINISHRYWGFSAGNKGRISKGYKKETQ